MNTIFKNFKSNLPALLLFILLLNKFKISAQGDDCSNALVLTNFSNFCSANAAYTTTGSTTSTTTTPSCWTNSSNNDVWFQFTAIGTTVNISINGNSNGTIINPNIALYSGTCGGLTQIGCSITNFLYPNTVSVFNSTLTIGTTYYVRVNGTSPGTFQLCINNFIAVPTTNQDCITASVLCSTNPIACNSFNGAGNNQNEVGTTCIPAEMESSWYTWTAANNGTLTLSILPNNQTDDIDFFIFELVGGSCSNQIVKRCCSSSCLGPGGLTGLSLIETDTLELPGCTPPDNGAVKYIDMVAGSVYGIFINNVSGQGGFNLSFGGTGNFLGPTSSFTMSDSVVCGIGTPVTFTNTSSGNSSLLWHFGANASIDTSSSANPQVVSFNAPGVYTVSLVVSSLGCTVVSYKTVTVIAAPVVDLGNDTILCPGNSITLNAGNANTGCIYAWTPGLQTTQTISVSALGNYLVTVSNSCFSVKDSITVSFFSAPTVSLGPDKTFCVGDSITLDANNAGPYTTYLWQPNGQTSETITVSQSEKYTVTVTLHNCVSGKDSVQITVEDCELIIPNVFSPNADNINDKFSIKGIEKHPNSSLTIYNRWGNKIYESANYNNEWAGTKQSDGIYYYVLNLSHDTSSTSTKPIEGLKYGFITIVR